MYALLHDHPARAPCSSTQCARHPHTALVNARRLLCSRSFASRNRRGRMPASTTRLLHPHTWQWRSPFGYIHHARVGDASSTHHLRRQMVRRLLEDAGLHSPEVCDAWTSAVNALEVYMGQMTTHDVFIMAGDKNVDLADIDSKRAVCRRPAEQLQASLRGAQLSRPQSGLPTWRSWSEIEPPKQLDYSFAGRRAER